MAQPKSRTLWLIRHAKAVDPVLAQQDFDRTLAPRGLADVDDLLAHMIVMTIEPHAGCGSVQQRAPSKRLNPLQGDGRVLSSQSPRYTLPTPTPYSTV